MTLAQLPVAIARETALPSVVGAGLRVPLIDGRTAEYANLDHAASAPCLTGVRAAVDELLPWYAGVHRGAGFASKVSTAVYERARAAVRRFTGAAEDAAVVFTRNTTDGVNLLAHCLPAGTSVVLFDTEHHAALLPWRDAVRLRTPEDASAAAGLLDAALRALPEGPRLVVLCGASNVTGELWPVAELAAVARAHGARTLLDAAQLAPHRPVRAAELGVDYVVLSGHKLYAPFGVGALVGPLDWLAAAEPYLVGGGATRLVDADGALWADAPARHEAGSPNVVGTHALAVACDALADSWDAVTRHEEALLERLRAGLAQVPGVRTLDLFGPAHERVGVVSFVVDGYEPGLVAAYLSAEHGIGVRDGAFCAHIAVARLAKRAGAGTQAVRASVGLGTAPEHVERLVAALRLLAARGPRGEYAVVEGKWAPVADPRPLPASLLP